MPETNANPSTTGGGTPAAAPAPAATPAPQMGQTPGSWHPPSNARQDFARWDKMEKPAEKSTESNEELVDPDIDAESGEKILHVDDIDPSLSAKPSEEKKSDAVKPDTQQQQQDPSSQQPQNTEAPPQRDYSQFDEEGQKVLKRAPNAVFAYVEKLSKSVKERDARLTQINEELTKVKSGRIPDSYLDHPEAYTLAPEYKQAMQNYELDQFEENHWATQLERASQGQSWQNLTGYDAKTGQPQYETIPARKNADGDIVIDTRAQVYATRMLQACTAQRQQTGVQLQQIVGGYKQLQQQSSTRIAEFEHTSFPGLKEMKPELKADVDNYIKSLPPEIQRNPLAQYIAKGALLVGALQHRMKAMETELNGYKSNNGKPAAAQQPTAKDFTNSGGSQEKMLDIRDFGDL